MEFLLEKRIGFDINLMAATPPVFIKADNSASALDFLKTTEWKVEQKIKKKSGQADCYIVSKNGQMGVLKRIKREDDHKSRERLSREISILQQMQGKGTPKLVEPFERDMSYIMEFIEGVDLDQILQSHTLTTSEISRFFSSFLGILERIHQEKFIHRDIKVSCTKLALR